MYFLKFIAYRRRQENNKKVQFVLRGSKEFLDLGVLCEGNRIMPKAVSTVHFNMVYEQRRCTLRIVLKIFAGYILPHCSQAAKET